MDTIELKKLRRPDHHATLKEKSVVIPLAAIETIIDRTEYILTITDPYSRFFKIFDLIGFNFEELANKIGYSESSVRNWYYRYNKILSRNFIYISHRLGLPLELFVDGIDFGEGPTTLVNPFNMASTEFILGHRIFRERIAMLKEYTRVYDTDLLKIGFNFFYLNKQTYIYRIPTLETLASLSKLFNVPISFLIKGIELQMPLEF